MNQLQSVLDAADLLFIGIPRFGHISSFTWDELLWFSMQIHAQFKILLLMHIC